MYAEIDETYLAKLSLAEREKNPLAIAVANKDLSSYWRYSINEPVTNGSEQSVSLASYYLLLGDNDKALDYLEKAFEQRDSALPLVNADFCFDSLRKEKRFEEILRKVGLAK